MTEALQTRAQKIVGRIKHVLSGPSNRSIISFNPPDPVLEMYRVANEGIQEEVERRRKSLEAKIRLNKEEAIKNTLKASATQKLALRSAQATRRAIIQK